jgi:membrane-associated protein
MSVSHFVAVYGPPVVFLVVFLEVFGLPFLPGELALVTAAALAQNGELTLGSVLGSATVGAVTGQAAAYTLGRWRGRQVLGWRFLGRLSGRPLTAAEAFFQRHGGKAVFLGRFVPLLRSAIGWVAGITHMPVRRYLFWNIAGALTWSLGLGLSAYFFGKAVVNTVSAWGTIGIAIAAGLGVVVFLGVRLWRRRAERLVEEDEKLATAALPEQL